MMRQAFMFFLHKETIALKKLQRALFLGGLSLMLLTSSMTWATPAAEEHRGLPQLNPAYLSPQIFWLFITFLTLCVVMIFVGAPRIQKVLKAREVARAADIKQATALRDIATAMMKKYEEKLAAAHKEAQSLTAQSTTTATKEAAARKLALENKLETQQKAAGQKIEDKRREALAHMHKAAEDITGHIVAQLTDLKVSTQDIQKILSLLEQGGNK